MDRRTQLALFQPTWRTVLIGSRIWFRQTNTSWMQAWVRATSRGVCEIEPVPGAIRRTLRLNWSEVFWEPPIS
jgi:hypothetical protein